MNLFLFSDWFIKVVVGPEPLLETWRWKYIQDGWQFFSGQKTHTHSYTYGQFTVSNATEPNPGPRNHEVAMLTTIIRGVSPQNKSGWSKIKRLVGYSKSVVNHL